ncbi:hypothetical protein IFM89_035604 [Coptis chinensis]|uniref:Uncharacterized protein n=1 Tax=Coptis chinensis TaxID=261450 RepID=A0A835LFF5_9MAGN|nr:hypothetical protein IFM89_035604 [Coptis chinensis]
MSTANKVMAGEDFVSIKELFPCNVELELEMRTWVQFTGRSSLSLIFMVEQEFNIIPQESCQSRALLRSLVPRIVHLLQRRSERVVPRCKVTLTSGREYPPTLLLSMMRSCMNMWRGLVSFLLGAKNVTTLTRINTNPSVPQKIVSCFHKLFINVTRNMAEKEYTRIKEIKESNGNYKIKVRVSRIWEAIDYTTNTVKSLDTLLLDEHGDQIHAKIPSFIIGKYKPQLKEMQIYHIEDFSTLKIFDNVTYRPVNHPYIIKFKWNTIVKPNREFDTQFPKQQFDFVDFTKVSSRKDNKHLKETHFTCKTSITKILHDNGWYYKACPHCAKKITTNAEGYECTKHGNVEPIPKYILKMEIEDNTATAMATLFEQEASSLLQKSAKELLTMEQNGS